MICPIDSSAHAYCIFDNGQTHFTYTDKFKLKFTRHLRYKIIDKSGLKYANFTIPLYIGSNGNEESLGSIKACTYNLKNGKIVETKLNKKTIIRENSSKHWKQVKVSLPNVQAGSIIELSYSVTSDYTFNLQEWRFQKYIPSLESSYTVHIPEYYNYKQFMHGYIEYSTEVDKSTTSFTMGSDQIQLDCNKYKYHCKNIPAFPSTEYLYSVDN